MYFNIIKNSNIYNKFLESILGLIKSNNFILLSQAVIKLFIFDLLLIYILSIFINKFIILIFLFIEIGIVSYGTYHINLFYIGMGSDRIKVKYILISLFTKFLILDIFILLFIIIIYILYSSIKYIYMNIYIENYILIKINIMEIFRTTLTLTTCNFIIIFVISTYLFWVRLPIEIINKVTPKIFITTLYLDDLLNRPNFSKYFLTLLFLLIIITVILNTIKYHLSDIKSLSIIVKIINKVIGLGFYTPILNLIIKLILIYLGVK
ncbi:hypothetical protein (mitochondrion) [Myxobolus squamalis]|uniref:Uncharacterized protein n=1 Tax=Myxobolus squamalis TaxID=59785 RepID=A0A678XGA4_MYXSQ|nr:hypothetical protein [Myxobolus squamalis]